jgi:hypothetical protein
MTKIDTKPMTQKKSDLKDDQLHHFDLEFYDWCFGFELREKDNEWLEDQKRSLESFT